jgi:TetR/AcrR family transcriptional repressor of nem operon
MARPREFEPTEALNRATQLFWQKGYEETSMADLVEATGVSRYGFYNEFGDKQDLFLKCIDQYAQTTINAALSPLEQPGASITEIHAYFDQLLQTVQGEQPAMGCLIGNTVLATTVLDKAVTTRIDTHYTRMKAAFMNALQNAVNTSQFTPTEDVNALADYLVGVANGFLANIRANTSPESVANYIRISLERFPR